MVHFRKRLGKGVINEINELIAVGVAKPEKMDADNDANSGGPGSVGNENIDEETPDPNAKKSGSLLLDATCAPSDIHYPADLWLLNKTREALEEIIDVLHAPHISKAKSQGRTGS